MNWKDSNYDPDNLDFLIKAYETAQREGKDIYMDADQIADIAHQYTAEGKFEEAQETLDYGFRLHPGNICLLAEQGSHYLSTSRLREAKEIADSLTDTQEFDVLILKVKIGIYEGKEAEVRHLIERMDNEETFELTLDMIHLYFLANKFEEAHVWIEKGKKRFPERQEILQLECEYFRRSGNTGKSIELCNRLIDTDPYNAYYWMDLAQCYYENNQIEKMIEASEFALAADDTFGEAYAYLASGYFLLGNPDAAIENYKKAIELQGIPPEQAYLFMAMAYSDKNEWAKAEIYCDKIMQIPHYTSLLDPSGLASVYKIKSKAATLDGRIEEGNELWIRGLEIEQYGNSFYDPEEEDFYDDEEEEDNK